MFNENGSIQERIHRIENTKLGDPKHIEINWFSDGFNLWNTLYKLIILYYHKLFAFDMFTVSLLVVLIMIMLGVVM